MNDTSPAPIPTTPYDVAAWILMAVFLVGVFLFHLLPALIGGLLVYELVHILSGALHLERWAGQRAKVVAVALIAVTVVGLLSLAVFGVVSFFRGEGGDLSVLFTRLADILEQSRSALPAFVVENLPADADALREKVVGWLHEHATELKTIGTETVRALAHVFVGMIIGAFIALRETAAAPHVPKPFPRALSQRAMWLGEGFRRVVFAQSRIAALNAMFTWIYLALVLPAFGVHLPLVSTLVAITFFAGLIPVVGNLVSNAIIVVVSLSNSFIVALGSLLFLIVIHKLEYFLNSAIIGSRIQAKAWELLLVIVIMEAVFGLAGVVAGPIYYAYLKLELRERGLI